MSKGSWATRFSRFALFPLSNEILPFSSVNLSIKKLIFSFKTSHATFGYAYDFSNRRCLVLLFTESLALLFDIG